MSKLTYVYAEIGSTIVSNDSILGEIIGTVKQVSSDKRSVVIKMKSAPLESAEFQLLQENCDRVFLNYEEGLIWVSLLTDETKLVDSDILDHLNWNAVNFIESDIEVSKEDFVAAYLPCAGLDEEGQSIANGIVEMDFKSIRVDSNRNWDAKLTFF